MGGAEGRPGYDMSALLGSPLGEIIICIAAFLVGAARRLPVLLRPSAGDIGIQLVGY